MKRPHPGGRPPIYRGKRVPMYFRDEPRIHRALMDRAAADGIPFQVLMSNLARQFLGEPLIDFSAQRE